MQDEGIFYWRLAHSNRWNCCHREKVRVTLTGDNEAMIRTMGIMINMVLH